MLFFFLSVVHHQQHRMFAHATIFRLTSTALSDRRQLNHGCGTTAAYTSRNIHLGIQGDISASLLKSCVSANCQWIDGKSGERASKRFYSHWSGHRVVQFSFIKKTTTTKTNCLWRRIPTWHIWSAANERGVARSVTVLAHTEHVV